jgi:hypothetical protein
MLWRKWNDRYIRLMAQCRNCGNFIEVPEMFKHACKAGWETAPKHVDIRIPPQSDDCRLGTGVKPQRSTR